MEKMRFFLQHISRSKIAILLLTLLLHLSFNFLVGLCSAKIDYNDSLSYGAASGKGQVPQSIRSSQPMTFQSIPVQSLPVTTTKTVVELTPMKNSALFPTTHVPNTHDTHVCIEPFSIGISIVQKCSDLKIIAAIEGANFKLQEGLENCELMDDISCDNGSGDGLRAYQSTLRKIGVSALKNNLEVGLCLSIDKRPDGVLEIKTSTGWSSSILCCRSVCYRSTTTSTTTNTPIESVLSLRGDPEKTSSSSSNPYFENLLSIPVVTTPAPGNNPIFGEMCIMPKFLSFLRVNNCEDLQALSSSADVVQLINPTIAKCAWVDDATCGPVYPGLGAYLDGGVPDSACLAFRQTHCGNVIGSYPILRKDMKKICNQASSPLLKDGTSGMQMIPMMIMPMNGRSENNNRRLREVSKNQTIENTNVFNVDDANNGFSSVEFDTRRLHGKKYVSKGQSDKANSDTVVLCCRLHCNSETRTNESMRSTAAINSVGGGGSLVELMPVNDNRLRTPTEMRIFSDMAAARRYPFVAPTASVNNRVALGIESDLCNARYAIICSLATPLKGERIVFDQRCINDNLSGCFAGGMPCCRSVNILDY